MKNLFWAFFLLFGIQSSIAQYTEIINSKRPGFSESPYSVGTKVYQFETGLFYNNNNSTVPYTRATTFGGGLFFRMGAFLERLEFNANMAYRSDDVYVPNDPELYPPGENYSISGFSNLQFGVKYLIYQQEYTDKSKEIRSWKRRHAFDKKRLIPSVGVYAGINTDFLSEDYKKDGISFKGAVLLQNDFSDRFVVLTNLIVDEIASDYMNYSYILTMTYAISQRWSFFFEHVGKFQDGFGPEFQFGTGLAYLFTPDFQVDASIRSNFFDDHSDFFAGAGFSYRIDRHQDKFIDKNAPVYTKGKKKGFFKRLFSKN